MNTKQSHELTSDATAYSRGQRRGSLKVRLLTWFLAVALVPLTVVNAVSYYSAKASLRAAADEKLVAIVSEKVAFINTWFHYRFVDLELQATSIGNVQFLEELRDAFRASGQDLGEFVKSYRWHAIAGERGEDLKTFHKLYEYHDVFLIDVEGNILFSLAGENDLGTNLFDGPLAETRFAVACRKTLDTGRSAFSDLTCYSPSNNAIAGFLTSVVVDEDGEKIGLFAVRLPYERIESEMRVETELAAGVQTYLVGLSDDQDGITLRTSLGTGRPTKDAPGSRASQPGGPVGLLTRRVDTEQTRLWLEEHGPGGTEVQAVGTLRAAFVYDGPNGDPVLGAHMNLAIGDVTWAVIAEVPEQVAFAHAQDLGIMVLLLVVATGAVVVVIATVITSRIVRPIARLSEGAKCVSRGDLNRRIESESTDELGELAQSFNGMVTGCARRQTSSKGRIGSRPPKRNWATRCAVSRTSARLLETWSLTWPSTWAPNSARSTSSIGHGISNWSAATRSAHARTSPTGSASAKGWSGRPPSKKSASS